MSDYIKREDAAKIICDWCGVCPTDRRDIMGCDDICPQFAAIPSADVVERSHPVNGYMWICPRCGLDVHSDYEDCPKCGLIRPMKVQLLSGGEWIPCSERLPSDYEAVNVTWVNHSPMPYYASIKCKPYTGTARYYKPTDRWYWESPICGDMLAEYGHCNADEMDNGIEVLAWMPLPEPYQPKERSE